MKTKDSLCSWLFHLGQYLDIKLDSFSDTLPFISTLNPLSFSILYDQISSTNERESRTYTQTSSTTDVTTTAPSAQTVQLSPHFIRHHDSVTGTIFPSIFPPLIHTGAVELRLAQLCIDVIMETTEPLGESVAAAGVRSIGF